MPIPHQKKQRIPLDLEPAVMTNLIENSKKLGVNRTKLARIFIKYGLANIDEAIDYGDKIIRKNPPKEPTP